MQQVYILSSARTAVGSFLGGLSGVSGPELGAAAIKAALERSGLDLTQHTAGTEGFMGCVLTAGVGQAPARQAMRKAGVPDSIGATTIGKVCGSGMKAVMLGRTSILAGDSEIVIAGGMESMSQAPHLLKSGRNGQKMGSQTLVDSMIHDGLWDPYNDIHMGQCAEACVTEYAFTREAQDAYARRSFERARAAQDARYFESEITPVSIPQRKGDPVLMSRDEGPRAVDIEKMSGLKPVFDKNGTITAGNASTLNDGAAALILASEKIVTETGVKPLARIVAIATHSQDPKWFTTAPVGAIQSVLDKAGLSVDDIDCFEINEAFAAVAMAAIHDLKLDDTKVNPSGGAIALGHPIGASGARLLVTLLHTLSRTGARYGLASLCIGGGEATAMIIENLTL